MGNAVKKVHGCIIPLTLGNFHGIFYIGLASDTMERAWPKRVNKAPLFPTEKQSHSQNMLK